MGSAAIDLRIEDPTSDVAQRCLQAYFDELDARFDSGFDLDVSVPVDAHELTEPAGLFVIAWRADEPVGCAALRLHGAGPAEIKRMWVSPSARGIGLGRRLLTEMEEQARERGASATRLDTNRALVEAIALYRSAGYAEIDAFNDEPHADYWFEKLLGDGD